MTEPLVALLTAIPIGVVALHGYRVGGSRLAVSMLGLAVPWSLGILLALLAARSGWFGPLGLLTPLLLGLATMALAGWAFRRAARRLGAGGARRPVPRLGRVVGLALGAGAGAALASGLWMAGSLLEALVSSPPSPSERRSGSTAEEAEGLVPALLRTAHRGFVRHIPWIGPLSDEVEAVTVIVGTDPAVQRELVEREGWQGIAELPSFRAIVADREVMREVARAGEGDLQALYRLQRHPLILAFCREDAVWEIVCGTRPTQLARELADIQRAMAKR